MQIPRQFRLAVLLPGLLASTAIAQDAPDQAPETTALIIDEFDRGTPLRCANGFSAAIDRGDSEVIGQMA